MEENNKKNNGRRGFLKMATLASAALAVPSGLNKVFASETRLAEQLQRVIIFPVSQSTGH